MTNNSQHNIVGRYMLCLFANPVACCYCVLLGDAKFETDQTFSYVQTEATTPNNVGSCLANKVASACTRLTRFT